MKKALSLILCLSLFFSIITFTFSCADDSFSLGNSENNSDKDNPNKDNGGSDLNDKIISPTYQDYGRGTVNFEEITYSRPDLDSFLLEIEGVSSIIKEKSLSYDEQLQALYSLDDSVNSFLTLKSYCMIMKSKDSSDQTWLEEYNYITSYEPNFLKAYENLLVDAANSPHNENFENDYFGEGLIEKYKDGGKYTNEIIELMERETELENAYSALSTANISIFYRNEYKSTDEHLADLKSEKYDCENDYNSAYNEIMTLYTAEYDNQTKLILIDLFRVRKLIANKHGFESYADVAYSDLGRDYTEKELLYFIDDITRYILPVYAKLNYAVFSHYTNAAENAEKVTKNKVLNSLYSIYLNMDTDFSSVYSYMLQHNLYDFEPQKTNRFQTSFVTYLMDNNSPFLFLTAKENNTDYITLAHEFGHFCDYYVNMGGEESIDIAEISSMAMEYLTLLELEDTLDADAYKLIYYQQLQSVLKNLIIQGFYALFEHYAYSLDYNDINEESLTEIAKQAGEKLGINTDILTINAVTIPHIMISPFYVQSYCTSSATALEIFYLEKGSAGSGISAYKDFVSRGYEIKSLKEELSESGLTSPFENDFLKVLADMIHYDILGFHYFAGSQNTENAA